MHASPQNPHDPKFFILQTCKVTTTLISDTTKATRSHSYSGDMGKDVSTLKYCILFPYNGTTTSMKDKHLIPKNLQQKSPVSVQYNAQMWSYLLAFSDELKLMYAKSLDSQHDTSLLPWVERSKHFASISEDEMKNILDKPASLSSRPLPGDIHFEWSVN